ncbi:MAG: 23S rRNA methyltransferase [Proteobacteria bacterium]|nr:23S rRNA methyltransferase [Pseudomonadota bacterium]
MNRPKGTNKSWHDRHVSDPYVQKANHEGYRSRAVYKLEELLRLAEIRSYRGMFAVDLGAAPGGWSQYLARQSDEQARVVAIDLLEMEPLPGVEFIQGDFTEEDGLSRLRNALGDQNADLVMSDMAPNISGNRSVDQPRAMYLAELALDLAAEVLTDGGTFVCKLFQGEGFDAYIRRCRKLFSSVRIKKPAASRDSSREVYVLARNYLLV